MNAQEARKITDENRIIMFEKILYTIETMAMAGNYYAALDKDKIDDASLKKLNELGYKVTERSLTYLIEW